MSCTEYLENVTQNTQQWLDLRKTKITATDACIIMGASHWKTKGQLYFEKNNNVKTYVNEKMQRGIELEPIARDLFCIQNEIKMSPMVLVKDWAMASLDGISECRKYIVEIKCAGEKDHKTAVNGKIPSHYYPQIQHQIYVSGVDFCYYYSFDGIDGVTLKVQRDDKFIENMIEEEKKFYECMITGVPPEEDESDYIEREDDVWSQLADKWRSLNIMIKELEEEEKELRKHLLSLSNGINTKGAGISVCHMTKKGNIDYSKISELKNIDLEKYRKEPVKSSRISLL